MVEVGVAAAALRRTKMAICHANRRILCGRGQGLNLGVAVRSGLGDNNEIARVQRFQILLGAGTVMPNKVPPLDDDDGELELEPVDPQILEIERQRAQRKTDEAVAQIDPD